MNWSVLFEPETLALYGAGLLVTLQLTLYSLALGAVLALACALALVGSRPWLRWPTRMARGRSRRWKPGWTCPAPGWKSC